MAINFPATAGQPTDGSYTHTVGNITWLWDGSTWRSGISSSVNESDPIFTASAAASVSSSSILNWNDAYGWGDHSSAGYLTSAAASVAASDNPPSSPDDGDLWWESDSGYLKIYYNDGNSSQWVDTTPAGGGGSSNNSGITLADLSVSTSAAGTTALSYDNVTGVFSYTPPDLSSYLTSFSINDASDVVVTSKTQYQVLQYDGSNWINAYPSIQHCYDVRSDTNPSNNELLQFNSGSNRYEYQSPFNIVYNVAEAGGTPSAGQVLSWDGSNFDWINQSGGSGSSYSNSDVDTHLNISGASANQVLSWTGTDYDWVTGTETDTLDSVTGRGATTTNNIEVGNLDASGLSARDDILTLGASSATFTINFSQNTGASPQIRNTIAFGADSGLGIYGAYSGGGTHLEDIFLGTSGSRSKFKNLDPQSDVAYDLGSSTKKWNNIYAGNVESDSFVKSGGTSSEYLMADGSVNSSLTMGGSMTSNIIPDTNDAYDIGSASYKIRDIYEADPSDIRLKTDVVSYTGGLKFVESLRVVDFTWKEDVDVKAGKRETGLIAQEVKEALDASNYNSWRLHTDGDMQGIDKKQLIPALVSAIQELNAEIKELKKSCNNHL